MTSLQEELVKLEVGFWEATQNPDYYRENMADDGVAVFSQGVMGKDGAMQSTTNPGSEGWSDIQLVEPRVVQITDDVAALVYRGTAKKDGKPYSANAASVYRRGMDGRWMLVMHQQSANEPALAKA
jgi:hypothetical protein